MAQLRHECFVVLGGGALEQLHDGRLVADHLPVLRAERQNLVTLVQEQPKMRSRSATLPVYSESR